MRYAVISDVHSNWEAITRVLEEIRARNVDQIVCLGDVVGYGADPGAVLKLISQTADAIVMGNHDRAVEDVPLRDSFTDWARAAIEWTAGVLTESEKKIICDFIPMMIDREANVTWTHASAHEPEEYHYLFTRPDVEPSFKKLETDFCFFGHTHVPSLFSEHGREARYLPAGVYQLKKGERYLINPGSVGQPRDRNPKLGFAFFDSDELRLEIVRLDYDNQKAAEKIRKAGLPEYLAARLL